jgi:hypothetical protein
MSASNQTETIDPLALHLGLEAGWQPGKPPWVSQASHAIDQETAAESECGVCGRHGLACFAFFRLDCPHQRRYRCYAVCPSCEASEQF